MLLSEMLGMNIHLIEAIGPALLVSLGYIDLGKWVAIIDGGARFGFGLSLILGFLTWTAVFCQYIASHIGTLTNKSLAQIYSEEYCRLTCLYLGVIAQLSMAVSELSMIVGVAYGINVTFGMDLFNGVVWLAIVAAVFPSLIIHLDSLQLRLLCTGIAGCTFIFYVLGVLISQGEIPPVLHGNFSEWRAGTAGSMMVLLGANIVPHNFYIQTLLVQERRLRSARLGSFVHEQFFAIFFTFTGIFFVNFVLGSSAAVVFEDTGPFMLHCQDAFFLMDQIYRNLASPLPFVLAFVPSCLVNALVQNNRGEALFLEFVGGNLPIWFHRIPLKALTTGLTLYSIQIGGAEGIYELLLFCQIMLAVILPSSVVPLFRVASSRLLVGVFRISCHLQYFAVVAFIVMFGTQVIFLLELLLGNSYWIAKMRGDTGSGTTLAYIVLLLLIITSVGFTLHLVFAPFRSSSDAPNHYISDCYLRKDQTEPSEVEGNDSDDIVHVEDQENKEVTASDKIIHSKGQGSTSQKSSNLSEELDLYLPETITDTDNIFPESPPISTPSTGYGPRTFHSENAESTADVSSIEIVDDLTAYSLVDMSILDEDCPKEPLANFGGTKVDIICGIHVMEVEDLHAMNLPSASNTEIPELSPDVTGKGGCTSDSSSKATASAMRRAAKRQFALILEEFWSKFFDYHGKLTQEGMSRRVDILLGLDIDITKSSVNAETAGSCSSMQSTPEALEGSVSARNSDDYNLPSHQCFSGAFSPNIVQMRGPSFPARAQFLNAWDYPSTNGYAFEMPSSDREDNSSSIPKNRTVYPDLLAKSDVQDCLDRQLSILGQRGFHSARTPGHTEQFTGLPQLSDSTLSGKGLPPTLVAEFPSSKYHEGLSSQSMGLYQSPMCIWSKGQFEKHFTSLLIKLSSGVSPGGGADRPICPNKHYAYGESEAMVLQSYRACIAQLLELDGIASLLTRGGGCDEELIYHTAIAERARNKEAFDNVNQAKGTVETGLTSSICPVRKCGTNCIWQASLIVSFGVWCIRRILELSLIENRPEHWGKYTYVLNRLQGILAPAFARPRTVLKPCKCVKLPEELDSGFQLIGNPNSWQCTTADEIISIVRRIEAALSGRNGRAGTVVGNVAYPKGKQNLTSVLKRYKRHLSNMSSSS